MDDYDRKQVNMSYVSQFYGLAFEWTTLFYHKPSPSFRFQAIFEREAKRKGNNDTENRVLFELRILDVASDTSQMSFSNKLDHLSDANVSAWVTTQTPHIIDVLMKACLFCAT
mmetsp:Transcript_47585/g.123266  ORF Transcript_47585/g.123266 Transcript_47585/m.123266 type:complete len:113 (+) Transcript_47585:723-1061(+)